jgi:transcriptional regulator of heat shock response
MANLDDLKNTVKNADLNEVKNRVQEKISNINVDDVKNNVRRKVSALGDQVNERLNRIPKPIDPRTHAVLDYLVTGYFLCSAGMFWGRNRRAA